MGNKFIGAAPSARESARIAWRERVNRAAREWDRAENAVQAYLDRPDYDGRGYGLQGLDEEAEAACYSLGLALSAPRPWRSTGKPTPRRRYSRAHRRGCLKCQVRGVPGRYCFTPDDAWNCSVCLRDRQNPHGRRA